MAERIPPALSSVHCDIFADCCDSQFPGIETMVAVQSFVNRCTRVLCQFAGEIDPDAKRMLCGIKYKDNPYYCRLSAPPIDHPFQPVPKR